MRQFLPFLWLSLLSLCVFSQAASDPDYHEQLVLRPLPLSALLASFNFRSNTTVSEFEKGNFRFFPRSLGQILQHAGTRELHLRFSLGRWDAESWGARPWHGAREGGTGVELWAWLEADTDDEADRKWLTLTNALSGLFCASLNFIDGTRTTRPVMSFQPEGDHSSDANLQLLYGVLPHEVVCTENLTPFLKLLPCKGKAGIATLLDGHKLFDASWQTMAIDIRPICPTNEDCVLQIEQTVDMVLDIDRSKRPRDNPIPRPPPPHELPCDTSKPYHAHDTCFPVDHTANQDWSLSQIFGKAMKGTCPLTDPDVPPVCLQVPNTRSVFVSEGVREKKSPDQLSRCFEIPPSNDFEIVLPPPDDPGQSPSAVVVTPETPLLYAERSFTGHGQERGGVRTILRNPSPDSVVEFIYMETLPWFMRIYLHTMEARIAGHSQPDKSLVQQVYYRPALDRARGTQLEVRMRVPPASTVFLTYDFEKSILRYTEYPPDANRGFDVAAAVITVLDARALGNHSSSIDGGRAKAAYYLRTTSLLCSLPTPDFSMPYNVIIFTSTAIALAFGGMFNILVRRFVAADEGPEVGLGVVIGGLQGRLQRLVKGVRGKR
ncbi:GPI transamidase component PIG-T [Achaetomium macrosporum]|uniref:GPI transamidase component PIG-T n=1 Tax=Achaetomium macrosporum TaxID=79813 RepID=A0AAN7C996_9PEZI|nr:GPI transamidase component PIG-T [Achaetomium macrosporum]